MTHWNPGVLNEANVRIRIVRVEVVTMIIFKKLLQAYRKTTPSCIQFQGSDV